MDLGDHLSCRDDDASTGPQRLGWGSREEPTHFPRCLGRFRDAIQLLCRYCVLVGLVLCVLGSEVAVLQSDDDFGYDRHPKHHLPSRSKGGQTIIFTLEFLGDVVACSTNTQSVAAIVK